MTLLERLQSWARALKREIGVLSIVARDPRTPWFVKALTVAVVAYALSPIDLIPDFIPVLGLVDEVILLPLAMRFILKLVPADVLADARAQADGMPGPPRSMAGAAVIVAIWLTMVTLLGWWWWSSRA